MKKDKCAYYWKFDQDCLNDTFLRRESMLAEYVDGQCQKYPASRFRTRKDAIAAGAFYLDEKIEELEQKIDKLRRFRLTLGPPRKQIAK